jgi:hypothetical protein
MRRAFSTAEMVIGVLILGAALIPIYQIFTNSAKTAGSSKYAYIAAHVARETIEELRQVPYDKLSTLNTSTPQALTGGVFATTARVRAVSGEDPNGAAVGQDAPQYPAEYGRIKRMITITDVDNSAIPRDITRVDMRPRLKKAVIEVTWEESGGKEEKSRPGLARYVTFIGYHGVDPEMPE